MAITAAMVKELRELSGAGMMDCKKALNETNGNIDEAMEFLRKNGQAKAEKKASRIAAEGIVKVAVKDNAAAIVEVNSETDFVAKNEKFQTYVAKVADQALATNAADIDAFLEEAWVEDPSKAVKDVLVEQVAVIGENLNIRRFERYTKENDIKYLLEFREDKSGKNFTERKQWQKLESIVQPGDMIVFKDICRFTLTIRQ